MNTSISFSKGELFVLQESEAEVDIKLVMLCGYVIILMMIFNKQVGMYLILELIE